MTKPLTFSSVQKLEARATAPNTAPRASSDPAVIRAGLIAPCVLRPANDAARVPLPPGVFAIDQVGIADAARSIAISRLGTGRFAEVVAQADPRVAARLREIASLRGVQLEAAA